MDHGVIDTQLAALLQRFVLEILNGVGIAHAQRQMAGGILVEQRVIEQDAGLADGRIVRHQSALAQIGAALVHGDQLGQQFVIDIGVPLHRLALVEPDPEAVDQLALIAEGLGGIDDALGLAPFGRDEALLTGDVGVKDDALQAGLAAAAEPALRDHAHREVGAGGAGIVQLFNMQAVEIGAAVVEILVMRLPRRNGVVVHPGGGQNVLPQLFHGGGAPQLRKQLLGPRLAGHGGDAPLILVLHGVTVGLGDGIALLLGLGHLHLIDPLEAVGVLADKVDAAGNGVHIVLPAGFLIVLHLTQGGQGTVAVVKLLQGLVVPVHHHFFGFALIALLHQHFHEFRLIQLGFDKNLLARLDVDAGAGNQAGIAAQYGFLHGRRSFFGWVFYRV